MVLRWEITGKSATVFYIVVEVSKKGVIFSSKDKIRLS